MKRKKSTASRPKTSQERRRLLKVVIDRAKWLRGVTVNSCLRDDEGKMCCLGFLGLACGHTAQELRDAVSPSELPSCDDNLKGGGGADDVDHPAGSGRWPKAIARTSWTTDSRLANYLMKVNDADEKVVKSFGRTFKVPDEASRERLITELMAEAGVGVTFVGASR
jgi:hypothetical protein